MASPLPLAQGGTGNTAGTAASLAGNIARITGCGGSQATDLARHCWRETRS